jgi:hypothetical protein
MNAIRTVRGLNAQKRMVCIGLVALLTAVFAVLQTAISAAWAPVPGHIMTPWAKDVAPDKAWPEYPRPQMVRPAWKNLNGLWDYAVRPVGEPQPSAWDGKILVPFCIESALSGVKKDLLPGQRLWYRTIADVPKAWGKQRVLLHFGAVDFEAEVWVNGQKVGDHRGGYDPFTFDITDAVKAAGRQEIVVGVIDSTNAGMQAVGKQRLPERRRGINYTSSSGIWQTVWLEPVPAVSIERLKLTPDVDRRRLVVEAVVRGGGEGCELAVQAMDGGKAVARASGKTGSPLAVAIPNPKLWSPDSPFLYDLAVELRKGGRTLDRVDSYFGMRKVSLGRDAWGITRILLNDKPIFQYGPLDQGYWPDGIYIPPTDEGLRFDVEYLKKIGCNMNRKHVVVAQDRWYYHCDQVGILVWQDMVPPMKFGGNEFTPAGNAQWEMEQKRMIDYLYNHPSIVLWTVFNEGWGQHDTERLTNWTMDYDPSRLVNGASGWTDLRVGHIRDLHDYSFHPSIPLPTIDPVRAIVLGEVGGHELLLKGHLWNPELTISLQMDPLQDMNRELYLQTDQFVERYGQFIRNLRLLVGRHGLCAAVYTQIADVEQEDNGWLTYDRAVSKIEEAKLKAWHESLYRTPPEPRVVLPASMEQPQSWKYTTAKPAEGWAADAFDDSGWSTGNGPFGNGPYGNTHFEWPAMGTHWSGEELYLRKAFTLDAVPERVAVRVYGLGSFEVYLNGKLVKAASNRDRENEIYACDILLFQRGSEMLRPGGNRIAVRCSMAVPQRGGFGGMRSRIEIPPMLGSLLAVRPSPMTRFIDVGLVEPGP